MKDLRKKNAYTTKSYFKKQSPHPTHRTQCQQYLLLLAQIKGRQGGRFTDNSKIARLSLTTKHIKHLTIL